VLSLSDLEMLLANNSADVDTLRKSVERSEAEMRLRELSVQELTELALAHFNLNNYQHGFVLLQEASLLSPNDVVLAGQVNSLAIRLEEIREQEESASSAPRGKKILVVDDSATVRKLISGKLEKSGHEVVCAEDGEQAVAMIKSMVPDLVLLDIEMPKMDGYQVCKMIRSNEATREVPVVMISGKDGFFDKVRGKMAGTTDYITKPFGPEALMKTLDMYLANGYKHQ
jgi:twitching motility two-component system response regulator PilG